FVDVRFCFGRCSVRAVVRQAHHYRYSSSVIHAAIVKGSSPDNLVRTAGDGIARGLASATMRAIAAICAGVEPQQPPTILTNPPASPPFSHSPIKAAVCSGISSYSPRSLGKPALG